MNLSIKPKLEIDFSDLGSKKLNSSLQAAIEFWTSNPDVIYCKDTDIFYQYKSGLYSQINENVELINMITRCQSIEDIRMLSIQKKREIIQNMKAEKYYKLSDFNQENLINFKNCFIDLKTLTPVAHSQKYISTRQLPYIYDKEAKAPLWMNTVHEIMEDDQQKIDLLQEFFGYCLTRDTIYEKALFLLGEGMNGKSTILDGLRYMLGEDNVSALSLRYITDPRYVGLIINKFANVVSEIPKNVSEYEDDFKTIVSGEPVTVNNKYEKSYDYRPHCKLIFAANKMPRVGETSTAIYSRMIILSLNRVFDRDSPETDKHRKIKLREEASGIFNWAVEGLKRLQARNHFILSKAMIADLNKVELSNNMVLQYFYENIDITGNDDDHIFKDDLFYKYRNFVISNGSRANFTKWNFGEEVGKILKNVSNKNFRMNVLENGRRVTKRAWQGIKWKVHEPEELEIKAVNWDE